MKNSFTARSNISSGSECVGAVQHVVYTKSAGAALAAD